MLYKLKYQGTLNIPMAEDTYVVIFSDMEEKRAISVTTDYSVASLIKAHLDKLPEREEYAISVISKLWGYEAPNSYSIEIDADRINGFKTALKDDSNNERFVLKPDQAVLLGLVNNLEFMATGDVFHFFSTPFEKGMTCVSLPITGMSISMLEAGLRQAVAEENYETASLLRDEMKRRNALGI